jgi:hypothetical protein
MQVPAGSGFTYLDLDGLMFSLHKCAVLAKFVLTSPKGRKRLKQSGDGVDQAIPESWAVVG